ncbi:DHHW family protein [Cohnella phaseoli]|uniref:DHHW motif protein n=1 Tax=Cohnella phaseoli TaxID=456490 RepID=A0A3D9IP61_9BACL|nr:DHHW family protein [Cohnella phaseoli]RED63418.1 DHHW motif protein [Cohnella phaseoli]
MKRITDRLLIGSFAATLFLLSGAFLARPVESFSELENRYLQKMPRLTWDNLLSKKFADEAESFVTDHFPLRADWIGVKSAAERLRLQQENNSIYKGKDGYLFEKFPEPNYEKVKSYVEAVKRLAEKHPDANISFLLAPTSIGMYPERLPWKAPNYPQEKVNEYVGSLLGDSADYLNGFDFLRPHAAESIYYRTDHHWTTLGAYYAYVAYAEQMGWTAAGLDEFQIENVSDTFLGSFHTRGQFGGLKPDVIQKFTSLHPIDSKMHVVDDNTDYDSLYAEQFLAKKDQYPYFLGGVHALSTITSKLDADQADLDKLLIVKDSYAHSLIPFLTKHVAEIHVIDIRFYNGSIAGYMEENGIDNSLLLFNTATFADNGAILKLAR